jgi:hypothetical protein
MEKYSKQKFKQGESKEAIDFKRSLSKETKLIGK